VNVTAPADAADLIDRLRARSAQFSSSAPGLLAGARMALLVEAPVFCREPTVRYGHSRPADGHQRCPASLRMALVWLWRWRGQLDVHAHPAADRSVLVGSAPLQPCSVSGMDADVLVNECALAAMPDRGEDDARYRLAESVFRRSRQPAAGSAPHDRRSGQGALGSVLFGGRGYIRVGAVLGIHPREMAALVRAVLRKLTTSPAAGVEDSDQV
jgi:hypothetical protein